MSITEKHQFPKVREIMTKSVIAFSEETSPLDVIRLFNKHRISAAPVVQSDAAQHIVGFITEADCMDAIASAAFFDDVVNKSIKSLMSTELISISEETDLFAAERFFQKNKIRHAPVLNDQNYLVGILARRDILQALEKTLEENTSHKAHKNQAIRLSGLIELGANLQKRS